MKELNLSNFTKVIEAVNSYDNVIYVMVWH